MRTTIAEMGPLLLARLMDATDAQEGVLNIAFKIADEGGLPLLDLKDLQALLTYMESMQARFSQRYGFVSKASVVRCSAACWCWNSRGPNTSSANRR